MKKRSEADSKYTWKLEDMVAEDSQWEQMFKEASGEISEYDISTIPLGKVDTDSLKRKKLELFRSKVLDGRLAKFWNNTSELKYELHSSLSRAFKMNPRIGWVRGDTLMTNDSYEKLHTLET